MVDAEANEIPAQEKYEIIVVGYRWFWRTLERTIDSLVRTNKHDLRINVGLNSDSFVKTPAPLAMPENTEIAR